MVEQLLERGPAARNPALDCADSAATDFGRFLISESARTIAGAIAAARTAPINPRLFIVALAAMRASCSGVMP